MKKMVLNRRAILRGMMGGAATFVALPMLEAMMNANGDALADGNPLPKRFVTWFFGNGVRLARFEPSATGPNFPLSEELQPLAANQSYLNVCTGLQNRCYMQITHHEGMTAFSGYNFQYQGGLSSYSSGPTIDQVIADTIGPVTPIPSIQCGVSKRLSIMDGGTTMYALSHRGPSEPLYPKMNPQEVWNNLFGGYLPKPDDKDLRLSVLDAVKQDANTLRARLGAADKLRLDNHLSSIADLEHKIQAIQPVCSPPPMPAETNTDVNGKEPITSVNQAMSDLIAYAFKCDITRVASMLFIGGAAETVFDEINQNNGHHNNTHNGGAQEAVHQGVLYIMARFNDFLTTLRNVVEPDGLNLLDSTIVYCSSDCSEGISHSIQRQPIILAGHGRNSLKFPGIHYQAAPSPQSVGNMSDVLLSCLRAFDPAAPSVGKDEPISTTPLVEIMGP
jgi:hypothetical protein